MYIGFGAVVLSKLPDPTSLIQLNDAIGFTIEDCNWTDGAVSQTFFSGASTILITGKGWTVTTTEFVFLQLEAVIVSSNV